jgi:hypothetical protein
LRSVSGWLRPASSLMQIACMYCLVSMARRGRGAGTAVHGSVITHGAYNVRQPPGCTSHPDAVQGVLRSVVGWRWAVSSWYR